MVSGSDPFFSNIALTTTHSGVYNDLKEFNLNSFKDDINEIEEKYHAYSHTAMWTPSMRDTFQLKLEQFKIKAIADLTLVQEQIGKKDEMRSVFIASQIADKMLGYAQNLFHEYDTEHNQRKRALDASRSAIEGATLGKKLLQDAKDAAIIGAAITVGEVGFQRYASTKITRTYNNANKVLIEANLNASAAKIKLDLAQQAESALKGSKVIALDAVKLKASETAAHAERHMKRTADVLKAAKEAEAAAKVVLDASKKPLGSVIGGATARGLIIGGSVLAVKAVSTVLSTVLDSSPAH